GAQTRPARATSTATRPCSSASTASMACTTGWWSTGATRCTRATSTASACRRPTCTPAGCRSTASSTCTHEPASPLSPNLAGRARPSHVNGRRGMSPILLLLLQLVLVLAAAKACGAVLRHLGQPPVIGEMAGGLLLGPLVFGAWWPQAHAAVFPAASLPVLSGLGTLGVTLFMFIVGAELRAPEGSRTQVRAAISIGGVGIALP